jgi:dCTP diphosphatase
MQDTTVTLQNLKDKVAQFVAERDWGQFHSPKNLSMDIAVEAAELMEKFLWVESADSLKEVDANRQEIEDELADILMGIICFSNVANIDIAKAFEHKLAKTASKYPVDKARGKATKYTKL